MKIQTGIMCFLVTVYLHASNIQEGKTENFFVSNVSKNIENISLIYLHMQPVTYISRF